MSLQKTPIFSGRLPQSSPKEAGKKCLETAREISEILVKFTALVWSQSERKLTFVWVCWKYKLAFHNKSFKVLQVFDVGGGSLKHKLFCIFSLKFSHTLSKSRQKVGLTFGSFAAWRRLSRYTLYLLKLRFRQIRTCWQGDIWLGVKLTTCQSLNSLKDSILLRWDKSQLDHIQCEAYNYY